MRRASDEAVSRLAPATGQQFHIQYTDADQDVRAVVTGTGATLRCLTINGHRLVEDFPEAGWPTSCEGQILIPWPNRVRDGKWSYMGRTLQLETNERERGNALHGLVRDLRHTLVSRTASAVTLVAHVEPRPGYPFSLIIETNYMVVPGGLTVTHSLTNAGTRPAPAAVGAHPYLRVGNQPTEDLIITVRAASRVLVDDRLNPTGTTHVQGTPFDLSRGAKVGNLDLDTAYFDLAVCPDGKYRHTLEASDGRGVHVWGDSNYKHMQVFTTTQFPGGRGVLTAIAIEPTTAPPDALNSGVDLKWIDPGQQWTSSWGITGYNSGHQRTASLPDGPVGRGM